MAGPIGHPGRGGAPVAKSGAPRPAAGGARAEHREPHGRGDVGRARHRCWSRAEMLDRTGDPRWADALEPAGRRRVEQAGSRTSGAGYRTSGRSCSTAPSRSTSARRTGSPATSLALAGAAAAAGAGAAGRAGAARRCARPRRLAVRSTATSPTGSRWPASRWTAAPTVSGRIRTQWCHGAPGHGGDAGVRSPRTMTQYTAAAGRRRRADVAGRPAGVRGRASATAPPATAWRSWRCTERTGDQLWLERARRFAMHCIEQVEAGRAAIRASDGTRCGPAIPAPRCTCAAASTPRQGSGSTSAAGEAADPAVQAQPAWRFPWASQGIGIGPTIFSS